MGPLIGFVSVPRPADFPRPVGAFFSAVVEAKVGPDAWKMRIQGQTMVVTTSLDLAPGQNLRLRWVSQQGSRWLLEAVPEAQSRGEALAHLPGEASLVAAFVSQGLPLATERLSLWSRWMARVPGTIDKETWAASLEARSQGPLDGLSTGLQPWQAWQKALEEGRSEKPPEDDSFWDWWNSQKASSDPWLAMPLRWTYEGREDAGLLQAHWNSLGQSFDQWNLTAAPSGIPFRLEARVLPSGLNLTWRFFRESDRQLWSSVASEGANLSTPGLRVTLTVTGPNTSELTQLPRGIDVQA